MCGFQVDVRTRLTNVGVAFPHTRSEEVAYFALFVCILCAVPKKKMKSFFDEARLETNAPPLYCGVVRTFAIAIPFSSVVIGQSGME